MKNIKKKIEELDIVIQENSKAYSTDIYSAISNILSDLNDRIEEVLENQVVLAENFNFMDEDISNLQEELFEEVSIEDLEEIESELQYTEIKCTKCNKKVFMEESLLKNKDEIKCPYCNEGII